MRFVFAALAALLTACVFYLAAAFALWEINPGNWSQDQRGMTAVFSIIFGGAAYFATIIEGPK